MSAAGVGELYFIEGNMNSNMYCEILQQSMIPSLQKLGSRAVFQHDNDPKHTSKMTIALLKRLKVKVMDWPSMSPDLNPIEHLWRIHKQKVEVCKVLNICQLPDIVMEEWKSIPVTTCEALVNSMPRRVKAVLDNDGGYTKYWQLTYRLLFIVSKCHFVSVVPWRDIFKYLQKYEGCTQFCDTVYIYIYYIYIYIWKCRDEKSQGVQRMILFIELFTNIKLFGF